MGALSSRQRCQEELRRLTANDPIVARYALLYAVECLDLRQVNDLVDASQQFSAGLSGDSSRLAQLTRERFPK